MTWYNCNNCVSLIIGVIIWAHVQNITSSVSTLRQLDRNNLLQWYWNIYIYISCSTEIHDWLIEECACLPFGWPTLVVAVPKGNWQRGYKQRGTSDSRRSQFFSPESFPADGSCDLANFGSGWVFRSTRDYQNPFPLHTILPFQIFNFSSPAEAAAGKVRNWFVGKKSNK